MAPSSRTWARLAQGAFRTRPDEEVPEIATASDSAAKGLTTSPGLKDNHLELLFGLIRELFRCVVVVEQVPSLDQMLDKGRVVFPIWLSQTASHV